MQIALTSTGLIKPQAFDAWTRERQARIRRELAAVMRLEGKSIAEAAQANARGALGGNKAWRSFRARLYDRNPSKMPALRIGSGIPWLGAHEKGAVIKGPLLIPVTRFPPKEFYWLLKNLFKKKVVSWAKGRSGNPVLMARAEFVPQRLKKIERQARIADGGKGRIRKVEMVPIATLIPQSRLRKRLRFEQTVRARIPGLIRQFEKAVG